MTQSFPTFRKPIDKEANAMASKEVEVLDPTPTVEKLENSASERVLNRRHFIAALGVAGAAAVGSELVKSGPTALAQQPKPSGYAQADVLNFLLNIKYLKATLYSYITQGADLPAANFVNLGSGGIFNPPAKITTFATQQITDLFNELYYDELQDLVTLRTILGSAVANRPTMNLLGTGVATATGAQTVSPANAISILRMLEDVSASAFAGATIYLTGTNLQYATQALAVNGFHAGALRLVAIQTGAPYYSPQMLTTLSSTTQTQNSFTASTVAGSTTLNNFAPTNPITVGSILTGPGILPNTTITAVSATPVYTGSLSGTTANPNSIVSNVAPLTGLAVGIVLTGTGIPANSVITAITGSTITLGTLNAYSPLATPPSIPSGTTSPAQITTTAASVTLTVGFLAATVKSSNTLIYASPVTQLVPGQILSATGLPSNSFIAQGGISTTAGTITLQQGTAVPLVAANASATSSVAPTGFVTIGSAVITQVSSVSGILLGMPITGTGILAATTVTAIDPVGLTITMSTTASATTTGTSTVTPTAFLTKNSNVITALSSLTGLAAGNKVTGTGIPASTTITSVGGVNTATMSANATATSTTSTGGSANAILQSGNNIISYVYQTTGTTTGFANGQLITDSQNNIPPGTTITAVTASNNTITLSAPATNATTVTASPSFTGTVVVSYQTISSIPAAAFTATPTGSTTPYILVGVPITGPNIPSGTVITGIPGTPASVAAGTITISQFPTAAGGPEIIGASFSTLTTTTLTSYKLPTITVTALATSTTVTIPTLVTVTPSLATATLSQAATTTGIQTVIVEGTDNMDVVPNDPGTAALAAAGPAAIAGTSPAIYGGFFDTAGATTSSANNPAGSAFARTFSQVLTVLYGSTAAQTFQGGFFPNGVAGGINFV
jgi:hypothetical protein